MGHGPVVAVGEHRLPRSKVFDAKIVMYLSQLSIDWREAIFNSAKIGARKRDTEEEIH